MLVQTSKAPKPSSGLGSQRGFKEGLCYQTKSETVSKKVFEYENFSEYLTNKEVRSVESGDKDDSRVLFDMCEDFLQSHYSEYRDTPVAISTMDSTTSDSLSIPLKVSNSSQTTEVLTSLPIIKVSSPETTTYTPPVILDHKSRGKTCSPVETLRKSCLDKSPINQEVRDKYSGHRVTFNCQNEVASQDRDGTLKVTYHQLGEKIKVPVMHDQCQENVGMENDGGVPEKIRGQDHSNSDEWDNPFQPEGEVSQDAELILRLWKDGQQVNEETIKRVMEEEETLKKVMEQEEIKNKEVIEEDNMINQELEQKQRFALNGFEEANASAVVANMKDTVTDSSKGVRNKKEEDTQKDNISYPVALIYKQKQKNFLKKHCRMM